jgi:tagaturonate reductase
MPALPETVLQFGAGRFLRAFADRFIQRANDEGQNVGRVVIVQSTPGARADLLNRQPDGYNVLVRGIEDGATVERVEPVRCVSRALAADGQWDQVLALARSPQLRWVISNSTESGFNLEPGDARDAAPPQSMPAKLTQVLWQRFQAGAAPLVLLPCELIERNADKLRELVVSLAQQWGLPAEFAAWVRDRCAWPCSLVDCIITDPQPGEHPLTATDKLLACAEPYALWALERPASGQPPLFTHPAIEWVDKLEPYFLRKVRILNGLHTAMVCKFHGQGYETVQDVLADKQAARWVRSLVFEEIIPAIAYRVPEVAAFADQVWDRLRNPFVKHLLKNIALHHADKVRVRLEPTRAEYEQLFGVTPRRLAEALAKSGSPGSAPP